MKIFVSKVTGETVEINADPSDTVENVYLKVNCDRVQGGLSDQRLVYAGQTLNDGRPLSDYNIKPGSTLFHLLVLRGGMMTIMVQMVSSGARNITVQVERNYTIKKFKQKICEKLPTKVPVDHLNLVFSTEQLRDDSKLISDYGFQNGSTVQLIIRLPGGNSTLAC